MIGVGGNFTHLHVVISAGERREKRLEGLFKPPPTLSN